jgi:hypothetical protein
MGIFMIGRAALIPHRVIKIFGADLIHVRVKVAPVANKSRSAHRPSLTIIAASCFSVISVRFGTK